MAEHKVAYLGLMFGGGAGHLCIDMGRALGQRGFMVDFLVDGKYPSENPLEQRLEDKCSVVRLSSSTPSTRGHNLPYYGSLFAGLASYLRGQEQVTLLSNETKYSILSVWSSVLAKTRVRLILLEHRLIQPRIVGARRILPPLIRTHYPQADRVVGVSEDVTSELVSDYGLSQDLCTTVPNPIDINRVGTKAEEPVNHPWFSEPPPVVVGVGRLIRRKRFGLLIQAFDRISQHVDPRLVLLGDGPRREALERLVSDLGLRDRTDFLGYVDNPYRFMKRADLLVHPALHEGFGLVLVEALACGTPVVATNCPGGPRDILDGGEYGPLVDVERPSELADAMETVLADPPDSDRLVRRAKDFSLSSVGDRLEKVISPN